MYAEEEYEDTWKLEGNHLEKSAGSWLTCWLRDVLNMMKGLITLFVDI